LTVSWPQPLEGVTGDDAIWARALLSLDEDAVPFRNALLAMTRHLGSATLVGDPAPVVRRMGDRMRNPLPGDLVASSFALMSRDADTRLKGLGVLLCAERREWAETDAQWEAWCATERAAACENYSGPEAEEMAAYTTGDDNRATDSAYYIQYGPGARDICRWHNDNCVMVPVDAVSFAVDAAAQREVTPDGRTRTTFTRDSLIGGLADSGFRLRGDAQVAGWVPDDGQEVTVRIMDGDMAITDVRDIREERHMA
jgi:hypothetical protein